jgi:kumamolisin
MNSSLYTSIQSSITDNICGAISISFIYCSSTNSFFTGLDSLFAQAAAQGQSVFISSGDWGAAGLQYDSSTNGCAIGTTLNASEMAASPHVTGVGGTTFSPQYDGSGNDTSVDGVAPGGIESAWSSSGGGVSKIFSKPAWQSGPGVPSGSMRDVPDISMMAWAPYVFIGADSSGTAVIQCCWGGTSLSSPLWAGYSRVIARQQGATRLGLLNPTIYKLANAGLSTNGFEDVLSGNNRYNGVTGYSAGNGYDLATGWGSVDMTTFASAYNGASQPSPTATPTPKPTASPSPTAKPTASPSASPKPTPSPTASRTPTPIATPASLTVTPSSMSFSKTRVGHASGTSTVTLANPKGSSTSATITSAGLMAGTSFQIASSTCTAGKVLAPGSSCAVGVKFDPQSTGSKTDTLRFVDSGPNSPQNVSLSGSGR